MNTSYQPHPVYLPQGWNRHTVNQPVDIFSCVIKNGDDFGLKEIIDDYRREHPESSESNIKAWHSDWKTHEQDARFLPIIDLATDMCEEIVALYHQVHQQFKVEELWVMQYNEGDHGLNHSHYPYEWAFVYYVDVEPGCSSIIFEDKLEIRPENNMAVLFPSDVQHKIPPNSNSKRTVLSMNIAKKNVFMRRNRVVLR